MLKIFLYFLAFSFTLTGVGFFRRWSLRRKILDLPNERSSHRTPTPVGGGLIIAAVCLSIYFFYFLFNGFSLNWFYLLGSVIIVGISWLDDVFHVPAAVRFFCHSIAALAALYGVGSLTFFYIPFFGEAGLEWFGSVILFFWIVWLINAYNFMDGIDGIAGIQAVTAGIGWFLVSFGFGAPATGFYGGVLAASCLGFLVFNWQPAKIFMGDVGSAFLGYTFAVLPLMARNEAGRELPLIFAVAVLLVWLFVFDTLITVFIRILKKEKIWKAHREHLYQKLVIRGYSHRAVTIIYGIISMLFILLIFLWIKLEIISERHLFLTVVLVSFGLFIFARKEIFWKKLT